MGALFHDQRHFVQSVCKYDGLSGSDLHAEADSRTAQYKVVDEKYRLQAILMLMSARDSWKRFRWLIAVVTPGLFVEL